MKKYLSLALVVMFVLSIATIGFAEVYFNRGPDSRISIYTLANSAAATLTGITPNNRILGISYSDSSAGSMGIFDYATLAAYRAVGGSDPIAEVYCAAGTVATLMFPLPRNITNGVVIKNSATTGSGSIFYE